MLTRRSFLKMMGTGAAMMAGARLQADEPKARQAGSAARPPNVVWIYCDELRTDALGCYGNARLKPHTPHLDRLAQSGVRFTNHFCNSPVCVSSRVCTLTGRYPEETGVYNNEAAWQNFRLPRSLETFPRVFAQHGYATASFGKIHVARGMYPGETPSYDIFQHHRGEGGDMNFWQSLGEDAVHMIRSPNGGMHGGIYPEHAPYVPEKVAHNALQWMAQAREPYFVRLSILQPHTPVLPPERFVRLFDGQDAGLPEPLPHTLSAFERRVAEVHGLERMDPERLCACRLHYYAQVAWVDTQVGLVLDFLEQRGLRDKTVVVFGADHGNPLGDTGAFEKHTFTPTVHRVPFMVSWPGTLAGGTVRDDLCDSLDLGRTLFACAGMDTPAGFRGRNVFGDPAPDAIYSTIGYGETFSRMAPNGNKGTWFGERGWPRRSCVRTQQFRFEKNMRIDGHRAAPEDEDAFLADVAADPGEWINVADRPEHSTLRRRLSDLLDTHAEGAIEVAPEYLKRAPRGKPRAEDA